MSTSSANQWFIPYERLDAVQRRLVQGEVFSNGSSVGWVRGPAGTGKTIVLVHALAEAKKRGESVVFISFTHSLLNMARQGLDADIPILTYNKVNKEMPFCDLAVVDEVQDVSYGALGVIKSRAKRVILAGDETQRIFTSGASGEGLRRISDGNVHQLFCLYRLTPRVQAAAGALYPDAFANTTPGGKTLTDIELYYTDGADEGDELCYQIATREAGRSRTAACLFPSKKSIIYFANRALRNKSAPEWQEVKNDFRDPDFDSLNRHLAQHKVPLEVVQNNYGDLGSAFRHQRVVLQTYHSAKGLDYQYVCLPNVRVEDTRHPEFHRALFFVAITRASGSLIITQPANHISPFVQTIEPFCKPLDPKRALMLLNDDDDDGQF